jgi:death on curing protein
VKVRFLDLDDYLSIAVEVTGQQVDAVVQSANLNLADCALHAPAASFSGQEFYPDFVDQAAGLIVRLAKNHPLPDGNKRAAWVSLRVFLEINGRTLDPYPSVDQSEAAVVAIAAGDWDELATAAWLRPSLREEDA